MKELACCGFVHRIGLLYFGSCLDMSETMFCPGLMAWYGECFFILGCWALLGLVVLFDLQECRRMMQKVEVILADSSVF